jgi:hypothetical protein
MQYKLCAYKDSLPNQAWQFIWQESSPLYKIGGWKDSKEEFNDIIWQTLITPRYLAIHIKESIKATFEQLTEFKIGDGNGAFPRGTTLHQRIERYFVQELPQYESSKQNLEQMSYISWLNTMQSMVVILSFVGLIILVLLNNSKISPSVLLVIWSILVNAWVCGTFANAIDRLGSKMIWLVPLITILTMIQFGKQRSEDVFDNVDLHQKSITE